MKAHNVNNLPWPLPVHLCFFCSSLWPGRLTSLGRTQEFPCCLASPWLEGDQGHRKYLPAPSQPHHNEAGVALLSSGPGNHFIFLPLKPRDSHSSHVPVWRSSPCLLVPLNPAGIFANHLLVEPNSFPVCVCPLCPLGILTNRAEGWGIGLSLDRRCRDKGFLTK